MELVESMKVVDLRVLHVLHVLHGSSPSIVARDVAAYRIQTLINRFASSSPRFKKRTSVTGESTRGSRRRRRARRPPTPTWPTGRALFAVRSLEGFVEMTQAPVWLISLPPSEPNQ